MASAYDLVAAFVTVILSLAIVVVSVGLGWYVMWKLFLSRFQFVREILSTDPDSAESQKHRQAAAARRKIRRE